jgi:hypothetical protein
MIVIQRVSLCSLHIYMYYTLGLIHVLCYSSFYSIPLLKITSTGCIDTYSLLSVCLSVSGDFSLVKFFLVNVFA